MTERIKGPQALQGMEAEEFMAVLLWAQKGDCSCPAAKYFQKMGERLMKQNIKEV